jgi:hypothetical protein
MTKITFPILTAAAIVLSTDGGHHFAFTNTCEDGALSGATPSFRGIEPFPSFVMNDRENIPLKQERDAFANLLLSLTEDQAAAATLEGTYRDILAGPQADDAIPSEKEGLSELGQNTKL